MATETNATIDYINEKRLLKGLGPVMREPVLAPYKNGAAVKEMLTQIDNEKDLNLLFLHVCENGTVEDFKKLEAATEADFGDANMYRGLVAVCIEENYIKPEELIYEA